jgi:hypothetical protein
MNPASPATRKWLVIAAVASAGAITYYVIRRRKSIEDLATASGRPMFGTDTREYLRRVRYADPATLAPWRTRVCPECEGVITGDGFVPDEATGGEFAHVVVDGSVVLGCEGYFVVSPAVLGLDPGQWEDWQSPAELER